MARHPTSMSCITPYTIGGTLQTPSHADLGKGAFTVELAHTYFFPLGGQDAPVHSVHLQFDAAVVITSATIEDCNFPESDVTDYSQTAGHWIDEDPTTAFVGTVGAGTTVTNGVVSTNGSAAGGAMWHLADCGARRTRLKVVVGATGGEIRVAAWGKE